MILFNKTFQNNYDKLGLHNYNFIKFAPQDYHNLAIKKTELKKNHFPLVFITGNNSLFSQSINLDNLEYKFISYNFWRKFINYYWQETIFISLSNQLSTSYIEKLKSKNLYTYYNSKYKLLLNGFTKNLISGKIPILLNSDMVKNNFNELNNKIYIEYIWKKGLNWYLFSAFSRLICLKKDVFNKISSCHINKVELNSLPVFYVNNDARKIVLSESSDQIGAKKKFLHYLSQSLNFSFLSNAYLRKAYIGLIFISYKDALEYKNYVTHKYLKSSGDANLNLFVSPVDLCYKFLNETFYNKEFRLIPDLKEISNLLHKYRYYKNVFIDNNQTCGKNYFQGQPIYLIKPFFINDSNTKEKRKINYSYKLKKENKLFSYQAVFFNYKTAIFAWNKFKSENNFYRLPSKPNIHVLSLENFLKNSEKFQDSNYSNFIFIPSSQTYNFVKQQQIVDNNSSLTYFLTIRGFNIKNLCKKILLSLTRKHPVNI
uniref:Uncharacterized protein n=1 Tax=Platysiphonia delicata TaxID=2006979 RepID=A0A1Z1M1B6_9FLOR|nr:hypothetical protein [Platysiphonia delicata]ARW59553.1 hypothetical protein [Platysiphonia delicata]